MDKFILTFLMIFVGCSTSQKKQTLLSSDVSRIEPFLIKRSLKKKYDCQKTMTLTQKEGKASSFSNHDLLQRAYCLAAKGEFAQSIYIYDYLFSRSITKQSKDDILYQLARMYYLNRDYGASQSSLDQLSIKNDLYFYSSGLNSLADFKAKKALESFGRLSGELKQSVLVESAKHISLILLVSQGQTLNLSFSNVYNISDEFKLLSKIQQDLKNGDKKLDASYAYSGQYNLVRKFVETLRKNEN